jgi:hypothetical protein
MKVVDRQLLGNSKMTFRWSSRMDNLAETSPSSVKIVINVVKIAEVKISVKIVEVIVVVKIVLVAASDVEKMVTWQENVPTLTREVAVVVTEELLRKAASTAVKMVTCPVSVPNLRRRRERPWSASSVMRWVICPVNALTKATRIRTVVATSVNAWVRTPLSRETQMVVTIFSRLVAGTTTTTTTKATRTTGVISSKPTLPSKRLKAVGMRTLDTDENRAILIDNAAN